jgi:hypothetical protein
MVLNEWDFDCQSCDDVLKRERGCEGRGILPFYIDNERIFRCPLKLITKISMEYIQAYAFFDRSILPNGKGWNQESHKFMQAMTIIGNQIKKTELEKNRTAKDGGKC